MRSRKRGSLSGVSPSELANQLLEGEGAKPLAVVAQPEPEPEPEPPRMIEAEPPIVAAPKPEPVPEEQPIEPVERVETIERAPRATAPKRTRAQSPRRAKPAPEPMMVEPPKRGHAIQASGRVVRRITLSLPADVGQVLAHYCVENGRTQSDVVAEALREKFG